MQLMTWNLSRVGSRFNLLFEPYNNRVLHSAMGRFLDQPLDLCVGLIEPDGTERTLPFTTRGTPLMNPEQFERFNSCTWRGFSEKYHLRFEFNVHSVFYPQDERLCMMPAFYLEMRVNPAPRVRWTKPVGPQPDKVKLFLRLHRADTDIKSLPGGGDEEKRPHLDLRYSNSLLPSTEGGHPTRVGEPTTQQVVQVHERVVSLNPDCTQCADGDGLICELPVTEGSSGVKWRLVWGAHIGEQILTVKHEGESRPARFRYTREWDSVGEVVEEAIATRDDRLAHSRNFEKIIAQAPLDVAQQHLIHQSFQNWASNTWWASVEDNDTSQGNDTKDTTKRSIGEWFSVWEGSCFFHSTIDVEYNVALLYLTLWPKLLALQIRQWTQFENTHEPSAGTFLCHDMGSGPRSTEQHYPHHMEAEENCNFLLLLQAYTRWTGDRSIAVEHPDVVQRLADYLVWTDRDSTGFPSEGIANTIDDASPAVQYSRKQTYLAVKRASALRAAADLLRLADRKDDAAKCDDVVNESINKIEKSAWLGDHYATSVDKSAVGVIDPWTGKPLPFDTLPGWDAYSIYTGNGFLLPTLIGEPVLLDEARLRKDLTAANRENMSRYGCGHTSTEPENVWVSQNLWRDLLARYLHMRGPSSAHLYWDLQVMSNTHQQSLGFIDTYINNYLCHYPRGITSIGYLLAGPRLVVNRIGDTPQPDITVDPDRDAPARWPLLPLADWKANKVPVCVVHDDGRVTIECETDPVVVREQPAHESNKASPAGTIG